MLGASVCRGLGVVTCFDGAEANSSECGEGDTAHRCRPARQLGERCRAGRQCCREVLYISRGAAEEEGMLRGLVDDAVDLQNGRATPAARVDQA